MPYNTEFSICLKPHGPVNPILTYGFDHIDQTDIITLDKETNLSFNIDLPNGPVMFYIKFVALMETDVFGKIVVRMYFCQRRLIVIH